MPDNKTEIKNMLYILKGMMSEASDEERATIEAAEAECLAVAEKYGDQGKLGLMMAYLKVASEV